MFQLISLIFFCKEFAQDLESLKDLRSIFQVAFHPHPSFTTPSRTLMTLNLYFCCIHTGCRKCYSFFSPFSLSCLDWITPFCFPIHRLLPVPTTSIHWAFISICFIYCSKNTVWFSLYLLFLCWDSFCICFKCVLYLLFEAFYDGCALKYLLEFLYLSHFGSDIFWLSFWFSVRSSWFLHAEWYFIKTCPPYLLCDGTSESHLNLLF